MPRTRAVSLRLVIASLVTATVAAQPPPTLAPTKVSSTAIQIDYDVRVPMRDGATLSADIYRPKDGRPAPVILVRRRMITASPGT